MKRRVLLLLTAMQAHAATEAPTDEHSLNHFAAQYNRYVETLKRGQIDLKLWKRVREAWEGLR